MKKVNVRINSDGSVSVEYDGFRGNECFLEAQKIYEKLRTFGIDVKIENVQYKQEYFIKEQEKTRTR
jgi:hypothetical protein